ncbi:MAG: class I SAM-dependent rRNA methyltransferase [Myxococcales bacterium]|nr:class I SAM-dependent rRNA methyltransferase [Myxococcales bacterium]
MALVVSTKAAMAVRRGHPWVYRDQLRGDLSRHQPGDAATLHDAEGAVLGRALLEPGSPLVARVWSRTSGKPLDTRFLLERLDQALSLRRALDLGDTDAYRLVHGEGDRTPGIVLDRYADHAVLRLDGGALEPHLEGLTRGLEERLARIGVRTLLRRRTEKNAAVKAEVLFGDLPKTPIGVREHGVPYEVDLVRGQKTGAFLDQRENRVRVGALARGRRVLNLFSYAGGFSLHAALGGAKKVTSVDVASGAHATAQASFKRAGVDPTAHAFVTADVWSFLDRAKERNERWDLVVCDPPNMAPSAATHARALTSYRKLHAACAAVLAEGGVLCAASCSSHVSLEDFLQTLTDDTLGRDDLRLTEIRGAAGDHPVLPGFPEGRYLEFCVLR